MALSRRSETNTSNGSATIMTELRASLSRRNRFRAAAEAPVSTVATDSSFALNRHVSRADEMSGRTPIVAIKANAVSTKLPAIATRSRRAIGAGYIPASWAIAETSS